MSKYAIRLENVGLYIAEEVEDWVNYMTTQRVQVVESEADDGFVLTIEDGHEEDIKEWVEALVSEEIVVEKLE